MSHQAAIRRGAVVGDKSANQSSIPVAYKAIHLDGFGPVEVRRQDALLSVSATNGENAVFRFLEDDTHWKIELVGMSADATGWRLAAAAFEYLFSTSAGIQSLTLSGIEWSGLLADFTAHGLYLRTTSQTSSHVLLADMFWQAPGLWTVPVTGLFPLHEIFNGKVAHPLRPPKPKGTVYARFIPWLGGILSLDVATLGDLPEIHRWMNDPRVNEFWNEAGDENRHVRYLESMFADLHIMPLIGRFDGKAFSYFEVYWAKEDAVATFCDAKDYDRGCHVIVGDEACRGRIWFTAWLPSLIHFMFLDDPRTDRIVQEPSSNHQRQLRNLQKSGFSYIKSANMLTKSAAIMTIGRQRFFADHLWHPAVS